MSHVARITIKPNQYRELMDWLDLQAPDWRFWGHYDNKPYDEEMQMVVRQSNDHYIVTALDPDQFENTFNVFISDDRTAMLAKLSWKDCILEQVSY